MRPRMTLAILAAASVLATGAAAQAQQDDEPGTGALLAKLNGQLVPMPLARMEVALDVSGPIVRGHLRQTFQNPTAETLDAVYVFPLPEGAAVDAVTLVVGGRRYKGEIQEKEEAKKTFEQAKAAGQGAGLIEQHRPNVFRTSVANVPPHGEVAVELGTIDEASFTDGWFETVFPTTITARYAPGGMEPAESGAPPASLSIAARLDAGVAVDTLRSPSHTIETATRGATIEVKAAGSGIASDRDFVLRWRPRTGQDPIAGGLVEKRDDGLYALALVVPPSIDDRAPGGLPTQTVFVVDVSGSMAGPSIEQAKAALAVALDRLRPGDTFTLIKFDSENEAYSERFLPASPFEIAKAKRWVDTLEAGSGTEIVPALIHALALSENGDPASLRRVVLMTDGAVENEEQAMTEVESHLGGTRLHIIGIGPAPNRWLMKELAGAGRGTFESVGSREEVRDKTLALLARTERAVLTDVAVEWEGATPLESSPTPVPDLYLGRPLVVTAKLDPSKPLPKLRVWGRAPKGPVTMEVALHPAVEGAGIATRWARAKIASLECARMHGADPATVKADVIALSKRFTILSPYTSFVVVADEAHQDSTPDEDGLLPQGGTLEPLLLLIGLVATAAGAIILRSARS
ncbi:MAG TPA: VIT domain-containing protein [Candidatus Polarisedimenticolaceae bacterium]|nr:VIT domain-containing protein [Candidatus Polarisedimenticolaceae bacterium]